MNRRTILAGFAALALPQAARAAGPRFTVTVAGSGPDVILIPGLASSAAVWDATVSRLAPHFRLHAVQVAGFAGALVAGNADGPVIAALVDDLAAYARTATKTQPAWIGHSMGGFAALMVAIRHPDVASRALIVDSLPFYSLLYGPMASVANVTPQAALMRDQLLNESETAFTAGQKAGVASLSKAAAQRVLDWSLTSDRSVMARSIYDLMVTDARPDLASVKAPITVLYPYDQAMGPQASVDGLYAAAYVRLPGATLKRIDGSYHFVMLDQPAAFNQAVDAFLA